MAVFFLRSQADPDMLKPSLMELKMEPDIEQVRAASCCSSALNDYAHFGAHRLLHIFSARIKLCFLSRSLSTYVLGRGFFFAAGNEANPAVQILPRILSSTCRTSCHTYFYSTSICFRSCRAPFILSVMIYHDAFRVDHHAAFHVEHFPR